MDPGAADDWGVPTNSERVYRALMRAYPEEVRRRYADEMVGYFGDLCREERMNRGSWGVALLWARTLPDLLFTAMQERGAVFQGNAYLPAGPRAVARFGALCALVGGILGVAFHLVEYSLLGALNILTDSFGSDPFVRFFTFVMLLSALSLSSLGPFGLYGAVAARSGRPGLLAGAGAISSAASASLWLTISGYSIVHQLASGTAFFAPFEWVFYAGSLVIGPAFFFWFLGLFLLGVAAAACRPLPRRLRVLPLVLFALIATSYLLSGYSEVLGWYPAVSAVAMGFVQGLPFAGVAVLGWVLLRDYDAESPAVPVGAAGARSGASGPPEADKEKELLQAIRRHGRLTVAGVALEASLTVEEADRMLSELAGKGHLEVKVERGRLLYSLWEGRG